MIYIQSNLPKVELGGQRPEYQLKIDGNCIFGLGAILNNQTTQKRTEVKVDFGNPIPRDLHMY